MPGCRFRAAPAIVHAEVHLAANPMALQWREQAWLKSPAAHDIGRAARRRAADRWPMMIGMGTGSTGVAAIRAGKRFTGIELNPTYFATALRRITAAVEETDRARVA